MDSMWNACVISNQLLLLAVCPQIKLKSNEIQTSKACLFVVRFEFDLGWFVLDLFTFQYACHQFGGIILGSINLRVNYLFRYSTSILIRGLLSNQFRMHFDVKCVDLVEFHWFGVIIEQIMRVSLIWSQISVIKFGSLMICSNFIRLNSSQIQLQTTGLPVVLVWIWLEFEWICMIFRWNSCHLLFVGGI